MKHKMENETCIICPGCNHEVERILWEMEYYASTREENISISCDWCRHELLAVEPQYASFLREVGITMQLRRIRDMVSSINTDDECAEIEETLTKIINGEIN